MQSPFKQITHVFTTEADFDSRRLGTNLLFDFFGVFIGLGTAAMFIVYVINLILWLRSEGLGHLSTTFIGPFSTFSYGKTWRYGDRGGQIFNAMRGFARWWIGAGFFTTLVVIFVVGMLRTAQNAWDTARWMFAVYLVVGGLSLASCVAIYKYLGRTRLRGR